jgi:type II secretory pathway component PulK
MKSIRKKGFVFYLIIMVMALMAAVMAVLANAVNTMYFQTSSTYLKAYERNLKASGVAWAKQIVENNDSENTNRMIQLDVNDLNIRESALEVTIYTPLESKPEIRINTSCSRGRQSLRHKYIYKIEP